MVRSSFSVLGCLLLGLLVVTAFDEMDKKNCITTDDEGPYLLCVETPDTVQVGQNSTFAVFIVKSGEVERKSYEEELAVAYLNITLEHGWVADVEPNYGQVVIEEGTKFNITLVSLAAGKSSLLINCTNTDDFNTTNCPFTKDYLDQVTREVSIAHSLPLDVITVVVGWIYFLAWSISFYPQIFLNFYRRSVIGLSFDFLALNILGFLSYSAFNVGLFWIRDVQRDYFSRHPSGVNPVLLNDVIFSLHATAATLFTIFQCLIFKRGKQRVSYTAMVILTLMIISLVVCLFVSVGGKLAWLDFLYAASYIKLAITLIKYVPQAYYNFRRRSTVGWSIGNVLLDFTGGAFSILQMFLLSYNYDDWKSIFGDPTKFGLGLFSIMFDLLFMFQHYVLFRNAVDNDKGGYKKIEAPSSVQGEGEDVMENGNVSDEKRPLLGGGGSKEEPSKIRRFLKMIKLAD